VKEGEGGVKEVKIVALGQGRVGQVEKAHRDSISQVWEGALILRAAHLLHCALQQHCHACHGSPLPHSAAGRDGI
jgi:hypothetical protein